MMLIKQNCWGVMRKTILASLGLFICLMLCVSGSSFLAVAQASSAGDVSGTYTFLREGEFVQLTVDDGKLSGYISRFGHTDSDKGQFIDQFFDKTSLEGERLTFNTKTVHGVWYAFNGTVTIAPGKQPDSEGYRVIKGTLVQHSTDDKGVEGTMQRQVEFKSFPSDLGKQ